MYLTDFIKENEKLIFIIIIIVLLTILIISIYKISINNNKNKNKQGGLIIEDEDNNKIEYNDKFEGDKIEVMPIPKNENNFSFNSHNLNESNVKVYQSIKTYDSRNNEMKVNEQYNEYEYKNNKWENTFSKHFNDSFYLNSDLNLISNSNSISDTNDDFDIHMDENETIDDYAFKLDRIEGGEAYYKVVKLTEDEKNKFYGGNKASLKTNKNSKSKENVNVNVNENKNSKENANVDKNESSETEENTLSIDSEINENTNSETNEDTLSIDSEIKDSETNIAKDDIMSGEIKTNNEVLSKISNSFTNLPDSSFDKVNELMTISINGQLKTITQNQFDNIKKMVKDAKQQAITLSKNVIAEITKYIGSITTTFAAAITKISTYIAEVSANPINLLVKWLTRPKTIIKLGFTAIKLGIKNVLNTAKIIHPSEFIINMIYNNMSAFITIMRTFYDSIIYSKIIREINNAFASIAKPFKNNTLKYITFLKPYVLSLNDVLAELFNLFTPANLEKLLQDCLKIIFDKNELSKNKKKKKKLSSSEVKRKIREVFDVLKRYISKVVESIKSFANNFKTTFDNVSSFISGNIDSYSVPERTLKKLDI
jgi:hypothetical protein